MALKQDGTLVSVGSNISGQRQLRSWTDVTAIAAGRSHTVGLRSDGTVLYAGTYDDGPYGKIHNLHRWKNVVAIAAGSLHTVGLTADGKLLACGTGLSGACDVEKLMEP